MAKKKTQLDRAIEQIEADITTLRLRFESDRNGLETAVSRLREQRAKAPRRSRSAVTALTADAKDFPNTAYPTQSE